MHHKNDVRSKHVFSITDMVAVIFFWKFRTISNVAAKRHILSPHFTFSFPSLFLLIRLRLSSPGWEGNLRLKRWKKEEKEGKVRGQNVPLCLWCKIFNKKSQRPYLWYKMHLLSFCHIYGAYLRVWQCTFFLIKVVFTLYFILNTPVLPP